MGPFGVSIVHSPWAAAPGGELSITLAETA